MAYKTGTVVCVTCPDGAECPEEDGGGGAKNVVVDTGYWRTSYDSFEVLECPRTLSCLGGNGTDDSCSEGSDGVLCATCAPGWFNGISGECQECTGSEPAQVYGVIGAVSLVLLFLIYYIYKKTYRDPEAKDRVRKWNVALKNATPTLKLILVTYQIICAIEWELEMKFPEPFKTFQALVGMLRLSLGQDSRVLPIGCLFDTDFLDTLLIATVGPLAGLVIIYLAFQAFHVRCPTLDCLRCVRGPQEDNATRPSLCAFSLFRRTLGWL